MFDPLLVQRKFVQLAVLPMDMVLLWFLCCLYPSQVPKLTL